MKKYILIIITCAVTLPLFAFDFDLDSFEIDTNIRTEINTALAQELNTSVKWNKETKTTDNEIISNIKAEMAFALRQIKRNCGLRKNIFTRGFVKEQESQKQKYENMVKWDIPTQIYEYIGLNFDLAKVKDIMASCVYRNETLVVVRFNYASKHIIVSYDYNSKQDPITHIVNPM